MKQIIKPKTRNSLNNTYVGIYQSDFDTQNDTTHNIASRIISDWKFDNSCKRNNINRIGENCNWNVS